MKILKSLLIKDDKVYLYSIGYNKLFSMEKAQSKTIKLQPKHRALAWGQKVVPELRVNGVWLEQHGFKAGEQIEITIQQNQLTIKPLG